MLAHVQDATNLPADNEQDFDYPPLSGASSPTGAVLRPLPAESSSGQSAGGDSEPSRLVRRAGRDADVIEQWEIVQDGSNLFNFEGSAALTSRLHPATHAHLSPDDVAIWQSASPMLTHASPSCPTADLAKRVTDAHSCEPVMPHHRQSCEPVMPHRRQQPECRCVRIPVSIPCRQWWCWCVQS